jgi:hypothetical protein
MDRLCSRVLLLWSVTFRLTAESVYTNPKCFIVQAHDKKIVRKSVTLSDIFSTSYKNSRGPHNCITNAAHHDWLFKAL